MEMKVTSTRSRPRPYARHVPRRAASDLPTPEVRARARCWARPTLQPLDFTSVRKGTTAEIAAFTSPTSTSDCGFSTPPSLRRASTLTLSDDSSPDRSQQSTSPRSTFKSPYQADKTRSSNHTTHGSGSSPKTINSVCSVGKLSPSRSSSKPGIKLPRDKSVESRTSSKSGSRLSRDQSLGSRTSSKSGSRLSRNQSVASRTSSKSGSKLSRDNSVASRKSSSNVSTLLKTMTLPRRLSSSRRNSIRPDRDQKEKGRILVGSLKELEQLQSSTSEPTKATTKKNIINTDGTLSRDASKTSISRLGSDFTRRKSKRVNSTGASIDEPMDTSEENNIASLEDVAEYTLAPRLSQSNHNKSPAATSHDANADDNYDTIAPPSEPAVVSRPVEVALVFQPIDGRWGYPGIILELTDDKLETLRRGVPGLRLAAVLHSGDGLQRITCIDFSASPLSSQRRSTVACRGRTRRVGPICLEAMVQAARENLSWSPDSVKVVVAVTDDPRLINWKEEYFSFRDMGVSRLFEARLCGNDAVYLGQREIIERKVSKGCHYGPYPCLFDCLAIVCCMIGNTSKIAEIEEEIRKRKEANVYPAALAKMPIKAPKLKQRPEQPVATCEEAVVCRRRSTRKPRAATEKTASERRTLRSLRDNKEKARDMSTVLKSKANDGTATRRGRIIRGKANIEVEYPTKEKKTPTVTTSRDGVVLKSKTSGDGATILKREMVPDSFMAGGKLRHFKWTRWVQAIVQTAPSSSNKFAKCSNYPGYRLKTIFGGNSQKPALYEFAVQCPESSKKHVTYFRRSIGHKTVRFWDLYQFRHKTIQKEIGETVSAGCSIWVRRGVMRGRHTHDQEERRVREAEVHIKTRLDYAWKKYLWRKSGNRMFHRKVEVRTMGGNPLVISRDDL